MLHLCFVSASLYGESQSCQKMILSLNKDNVCPKSEKTVKIESTSTIITKAGEHGCGNSGRKK